MKKLMLTMAAMMVAVCTFAAELNIYASGLKAGGMSADKKVQIEYLLNAPATSVLVEVLGADNSVVGSVSLTDALLLAKGRHTATLDLDTLAEGTYSWRITATAEATQALEEVTDASLGIYNYYMPMGIAVDRSTESAYFGRVYVTEAPDGASDGATTRSKTMTHGVYIYDALLQDVTGQGITGYKGNVTWANYSNNGPKRIAVAEDGCVFIADNNGGSETLSATSGVWMMNPANPNEDFKEVLAVSGRGTTFKAIAALDVEGTGADRVMYVLDNISTSTGALIKFPIGEATQPYAQAGDTILSADDMAMASLHCAVRTDGRGGFWIAQNRWGADSYPALMHINASKVRDFTSDATLLPFSANISYRGQLDLNADKTKLAIGSDKKGVVFSIAYDEATGVPTLTRLYETAQLGNNIDGIAFDIADNLYVASASSERFYAFATPKADNSFVTPAPATQAIVITNTVVNVTGVSLDVTTADMKVGEQKTLVATVAPDEATNKTVTWSSSDETVATVTSEGQVSALKAGTATITVTTADGAKTAECTITVTNVDVESVSLNKETLSLYPGETGQLTATVAPANATNKDVTWATSDEAVATVSENGLVTALASGEATITVTTVDGEKTAVCEVTILVPEYPNVMAYELKLVANDEVGFNLNAPATEVKVLAYDADETEYVVATVTNAKAEYQTVKIDVSELPAGVYTWAVEASAELVAEDEPVLVHQYTTPLMKAARGVALNSDYNSPFFGQLYVADGGSAAENSGLYVFDPKLNGGEQLYTTGWSSSMASPMRSHVGEDGLVYITDWSDNEGNIRIFDPGNPTTDNVVFGGTFSGANGVWNTEEGKYIHGSISSCYVVGNGAERTLYTFDEDYTPSEGHTMCLLRYDIGELTAPWAGEPSAVVYNNADNFEQNGDSKILPSIVGGWWISQDRANDSQAIPALIHVAADGTVNYNSNGAHGGRTRGALAFNEDQTYCATAADNVIRIWAVEWSDTGVPTMQVEQICRTTFGAQNSSSCYDIAIDRALNVYASGNNAPLCVWALVKEENKCTTPAAANLTFVVEQQDDALENIEAQQTLRGVYDMTGRYLGEQIDNLPKGAYIVNGEKVIK